MQGVSDVSMLKLLRSAQSQKRRKQFLKEHRITEEDVDKAWEIICPEGGALNRAEMLERMRLYYPHWGESEVSFLMGPGGVTKQKLVRILVKHQDQTATPRWDRDSESWGVLDPHHKGSVELSTILRLMSAVPGFEHMNEEDVALVAELLGLRRGETSVHFEGWKSCGTWAPVMEEVSAAQRKLVQKHSMAVSRSEAGGAHQQAGSSKSLKG